MPPTQADILPTGALVVQLVLAVVAIAFAVVRARGPTATLAWIFAVLAVPIVGPLAYFALANPYVHRPRRKRIAMARNRRGDLARIAAPPPEGPPHRSVVHAARVTTGFGSSGGNRVEMLVDNVSAFALKERAIAEAKQTIWAEYYILAPDPSGRKFLQLLAERAAAGVEVRLLYDAVGAYDIDAAGVAALRAAGGKVTAFLPVNPLRRRWAVHLRNHRKILVADGRIGFVGGMNIGDVYAGRTRRRRQTWRDTHCAVEGPVVRSLAAVFAEDWTFMTGEPLSLPEAGRAAGSAEVAVLPSGPDQEENASGLAWFASICVASKRCWLTTPYFAPDEAILRALTTASRRGVDVRILLPLVSDSLLMDYVNEAFVPLLLRSGVRVFQYRPATLHAKTIVVDSVLAMVGSANVDRRSFGLNFEAGLVVDDVGFATTLEAQFLTDQAQSLELTEEKLAKMGPARKVLRGVAMLLAPLV